MYNILSHSGTSVSGYPFQVTNYANLLIHLADTSVYNHAALKQGPYQISLVASGRKLSNNQSAAINARIYLRNLGWYIYDGDSPNTEIAPIMDDEYED